VTEYLRRHNLDEIHPVQEELTTREVLSVIDGMPFKRSLGILTGGELFLRDDVWDILAYATRRIFCVLGTNATMIDRGMAERLVDLGVISLWIGLDGSEAHHDLMRAEKGAFKRTIQGIHHIQEAKHRLGKNYPIINTFTVIARENVESLTAVADTAEAMGVEKSFMEIYDTALDRFGAELDSRLPTERKQEPYIMDETHRKILRDQLEEIRRRPFKGTRFRTLPHEFSLDDMINYYHPRFTVKQGICTVPWWLMRISPSGDVYPCYNYPVGNVRHASLQEIWKGQAYQTFRKAMRGGIVEACHGCNYFQSARYIP